MNRSPDPTKAWTVQPETLDRERPLAKRAANKAKKAKPKPVSKVKHGSGRDSKKTAGAKIKRAKGAGAAQAAARSKVSSQGSAPAPRKRPNRSPTRKPTVAQPEQLPAPRQNGNGEPVDSKLTPEEIEQFRQILLEKRAQILGDVTAMHNEALNKNRQDASGDLSSMPIHMADLGSDNYELEFTLSLIDGERQVLREIDEALERIEAGTYGICLGTGKPIGKARLKAKPWAKYSYEYALAQERGQTRRL